MGSLWIVVDSCGVVVDRCGSLWVVVDRCGSLWVIVGRCGSFRVLVTTILQDVRHDQLCIFNANNAITTNTCACN